MTRKVGGSHFDALRKKVRLSKPLSCAIDRVQYEGGIHDDGSNHNDKVFASDLLPPLCRKQDKMKRILRKVTVPGRSFYVEAAMKGYSGADIAGLVRCAGSMALSRT